MAKSSSLVTRSGEVAQAIANDLMAMEVGERLPTVAEYAEQFHTGIGTIQKALEYLQTEGGIRLESRGQFGTFLQAINRIQLWRVLGNRVLAGVMPLPYSRRYEGLATGLHAVALAAGVEMIVAFLRGAKTRLRALTTSRYDFAIMSLFSAEAAIEEGVDLTIGPDFGPRSYVKEHVILFAPGRGPAIQPGYRVGMDHSSIDQSRLTQYECEGLAVETIEIGYMQLLEALAADKIQAAVWASDEVLYSPPGISRHPLQSAKAQSIFPKDTAAAIVTLGSNRGIARLLTDVISVEGVRSIQEEVLSNRRLPEY